jgi:predicted O-methyltransferase YrrM
VLDHKQFVWAESLSPRLLKSPWWIGHIPFAFELMGRQRPRIVVELGTYSGSSLAAFCQAVEAIGLDAKCYGVDLWEGDVHMGAFDESIFRDVSTYMAANYPTIAVLIRERFSEAVGRFADRSIDLLHVDGTHTYEAVSKDFREWLPKMSARGIVLLHDTNVTFENTGPAASQYGVRRLFDETKEQYPHLEFSHCWGLGVLIVGSEAPASVMELVRMARSPEFCAYFADRGGKVSARFRDMAEASSGGPSARVSAIWQRALNAMRRIRSRLS